MSASDPDETLPPKPAKNSAYFKTPFLSGGISGDSLNLILTFLIAVGVALTSYMLWSHHEATERATTTVSTAIREQTIVQREALATQREQTCLLALDLEDRKKEFASQNGLCKRLAR